MKRLLSFFSALCSLLWWFISEEAQEQLCSAHERLTSNTLSSVLSSGDVDDWEQLEVRPSHAGVQNVLYLNDEEEEEEDGEEVEQGQEGRKVTVRNIHENCIAAHVNYPCFRFSRISGFHINSFVGHWGAV